MKATLGELLTGPAGTAQLTYLTRTLGDPVDVKATLACWFLTCSGQSPPGICRRCITAAQTRSAAGLPDDAAAIELPR